jgi:hypothetical protein
MVFFVNMFFSSIANQKGSGAGDLALRSLKQGACHVSNTLFFIFFLLNNAGANSAFVRGLDTVAAGRWPHIPSLALTTRF